MSETKLLLRLEDKEMEVQKSNFTDIQIADPVTLFPWSLNMKHFTLQTCLLHS